MKLRRALGVVFAATAALLVLPGAAVAQPSQEDVETLVSDAQIIAENAPAAAQEGADGVQGAAETLQETQSTNEAADELVDAGVDSGSALVAGTEQFGALGTGLSLVGQGVSNTHSPWTNAIDDQDPSVVDPADLQLIAQRLQDNGADGLLCGVSGGSGGLLSALVHLLQGNVIEPPLSLGPAFYSEGVVNALAVAFQTTEGTPYEGPFQTLGLTSLVVGAAIEGDVNDAEAELAPVFEGAAPATGPIIEQIEAQEDERC